MGRRRRSGKHRPIGVAEKRDMLEAAGEEWPIGSDGLPMHWQKSSRNSSGGYWTPRGASRDSQHRYNRSEKGQAVRARSKEREIQGLVPSAVARVRNSRCRRDQKKIDELMKLLPSDVKELLNV